MTRRSCHTFAAYFAAVLFMAAATTTADTAGEPPAPAATEAPSPTAGDIADPAILRFEIRDADGRPMPGRLTFVIEGEAPNPNLFPNAMAKPDDLAVRKNIVASLSGRGRITVPPGKYTVYASRGLEWSIDSKEIDLAAGAEASFTARLVHEVDTTGYISGDFHLHTLTYSGHGDSNMKERIITIVAEGLEFAVSTDHNHHTNYEPTMRELGAEKQLAAVVGNEVSVPVGHFNAFPLDPNRAPPASNHRNAVELFRILRDERNRFGVTPIIQVNHPRWREIDYFGQAGLDPVTGTSDRAEYSDDFDSVEIFNENAGWGYYDADTETRFSVGSSVHSVLRDWYTLLNRGHRYAAVGNSDSHTVHSAFAAYPRNWVPSPTDDPARIRVEDVASAIRQRNVFTSIGPFVQFSIDGKPMGSETTARDGAVEVRVRVQAASWVDCDRVMLVAGGDVVETIPVPQTRDVLRLDTTRRLKLPSDTWIAVLVEGDDSLAPIVPDKGRPILPLAVTNPIWVDADGDGRFTPPYADAVRAIRTSQTTDDAWPTSLTATERSLRLLAAGTARPKYAADLTRRALRDDDRYVRLSALRLAERLAEPGLAPDLARALEDSASDDPYFAVGCLRALHAAEPDRFRERFLSFVTTHGADAFGRYRHEVLPLAPSRFIRDWRVLGFFPNPTRETLVTVDYGPESDPDPQRTYQGKGATEIRWRAKQAGENGYLDFLEPDVPKATLENAIVYAETILESPDSRSVPFSLGSDDGCRVWVNGKLVHEANVRRGANPWQHFGTMELREGKNRVLFKVENGTGSFGLYLQVFDEEVTTADER